MRFSGGWNGRLSCLPCDGKRGLHQVPRHRSSNRKFARHGHQAFQPLAELNVIRERFDMPQPPNPQIVKKVKKLSGIAEELRQGKDFPVTRLTTIKSLCGEPEAAAAFALFLAQKIQSKMRQEQSPERYRELVDRAVKEVNPYLTEPPEARRERLFCVCRDTEAEQNEY